MADETGMLDLGKVYENAHRSALLAVDRAPSSDYGIEDVATERQWAALITTGLAVVAVHGTLNGCMGGLQARRVTADKVRNADPAIQPGLAVKPADVAAAREWLVASLVQGLDEDARQAMVDGEVDRQGWRFDGGRVTSLVIALVLVASWAATS